MGTKYTGSVVPTLNNAPANAWTTDAEKACHVGELYLVDSNGGGDAGKVYAFSEYGIHEPKNATITDGVAQFSDGGDNLPMSKAEVTISPYQNGTPWISTTPDTEPYLYRALPSNVGNSELDTIVGGTINWNQLCNSSSVTVPNGHKYYLSQGGTNTIVQSSGSAITGLTSGTDMVIDLTAMFNSTIADYIYTLESGTAGSGVAYIRKLFPKPYYAYDAGSLLSVKTSAKKITGKNLFDPSTVTSGVYINENGVVTADAASGYSALITIEQATYIWSGHCGADSANNNKRAHLYDFDGNWIKQLSVTKITKNTDFTISLTIAEPNARYLRLSEWTSDTNVMLEKGVEKTTYEAYNGQTYTLDSDLELRGIPKLDANNNLYYDGDVYPPSGNVTRKYGIVDLGSLSWTYSSNYFRTSSLQSTIKKPSTNNDVVNGICTKFYMISWNGISTSTDMAFAIGTDGKCLVRDSAYTDASTFTTAMSGVYLVYELSTPTTESADPYTSPKSVSDGGTEEYVDSRTVPMPVGHRSYYANIVPITGETGTNLIHTGVNLLGGTDLKDAVVAAMPNSTVDTTNKYVSFSAGAAINQTITKNIDGVFKENTQYTFIMTIYKTAGTGSNIVVLYTDGSYSYIGTVSAAATKQTLVYTSAANKTVRGLYKYNQSGYTRLYYEESGIFEGVLTASQFKEYQGTTYNVTFTDQGTVYGGTYDFVSGVLSITRKSIDLGDISWTRNTDGTYPFFYGTITGETAVATANVITCMSDRFEAKVNTTNTIFRGTNYDGKICFQSSQAARIMVQDSGYDDAASFTEAVTGSQFVFELASPQTYTLTPNVINSVLGINNVWSTTGTLSGVGYLSDNMIMTYGWLETWTMPKITKSNGTVVVLPYPQEYTPEIYDVDAATTGRNAAGLMIRDRVARKHKFNYKWAALSQTELSEILGAIQGVSFTLTTADPETGAKTNYTVYPGNRSMPVYWYPTPQSTSWMYASLSANLIEM